MVNYGNYGLLFKFNPYTCKFKDSMDLQVPRDIKFRNKWYAFQIQSIYVHAKRILRTYMYQEILNSQTNGMLFIFNPHTCKNDSMELTKTY